MFHIEFYKTVGPFALKGTTYIDIDKILIALMAKNARKVMIEDYMIKQDKFDEFISPDEGLIE